ncbi:hypothetical protein [Streptomyces sp. NPDC018833]|uniref:hypothetical protein n=1 Tax=Streptomyces sp. NPDC018833 TaxID=3365053 RepID=UPI00378846F2
MDNAGPGASAVDISSWAEGAHQNAAHLAAMVGVSLDRFETDPLAALPGLQNYVSRLPLEDFEQSDWITLHTDLVSFLGDVLVRHRGGHWSVVDDASSPAGCRFVIEATDLDGNVRQVEPYDVVMEEFEHLPIEIGRLIANAEAHLHVTIDPNKTD